LDEPKDDAPQDVSSPTIFSKPESKAVEVEATAATEHGEPSGELDGDHQHGEGHHSDSNDDNDDTQQKHHDDNHQHQHQHEHEGWRD
jgi:ABC-type Zn2+ transport system substrate-binding protein/surface adhesin